MKTEKYGIGFMSIETSMCSQIEISKKEYDKQIRFLNKKIEMTQADEYPMEKSEMVFQNEQMIETVTSYSVGTGETILIKYECKPGYHFK